MSASMKQETKRKLNPSSRLQSQREASVAVFANRMSFCPAKRVGHYPVATTELAARPATARAGLSPGQAPTNRAPESNQHRANEALPPPLCAKRPGRCCQLPRSYAAGFRFLAGRMATARIG